MPQRKSGHVTLLDVAHACGFSVSTVSIVLSEAPLSKNVAATTRAKIQTMARKLGYHPDASARSLRRRRSQTIAVLAYDLSDPFCNPILRGIQSGLQATDYIPLMMDAQSQRRLFDNYLNMILEIRAEAAIVIASWVFEEANLLADIEKNDVPIAIIGRDLTGRRISSVLIDNEAGGSLAMRHLYELGHRKIAVIRGPEELFDGEPRWAGVRRVAAELGIEFDPELVRQLPSQLGPISAFEGGLSVTNQILASGRPFTAIIAFDDLTALGVVRGLTNAGLRVPDDCSVLGFDDVLLAEVATPGLSTIRQPLREMGLWASNCVLQALAMREGRRKVAPQLYEAPPELVVRMSTARVRRRTLNTANSVKIAIDGVENLSKKLQPSSGSIKSF